LPPREATKRANSALEAPVRHVAWKKSRMVALNVSGPNVRSRSANIRYPTVYDQSVIRALP
jgi:hypothetical protein